jgi:hypothetical protein
VLHYTTAFPQINIFIAADEKLQENKITGANYRSISLKIAGAN